MQNNRLKPEADSQTDTASILFFSRGSCSKKDLFDGFTVGRAGNLRLPGNPYYSRIHATFFQVGRKWFVVDGDGSASSANGVYINQGWRRIPDPHQLSHGDRIFFMPGLRRQLYVVFSASGKSAESTLLLPSWAAKLSVAGVKLSQSLSRAWSAGRAVRWGLGLLAAALALESQVIAEKIKELLEWMASLK